MSFRAIVLFVCILCSVPFSALANQILRVGMPQPGQVPFFWQDDVGEYRGIYVDTLRLIAAELGVELEIVPLSLARLHRQFIAGEIDLEAGVSHKYSSSEALQDTSVYSRPYGVVNEVFIYRPELSFPVFILKDLDGIQVATVRGAVVPDKILREDFSNQWQIAQRVHRGWNDVGLMTEALALHYQRQEQLNFAISLPYVSHPVFFRLHKSQQHLLTAMNASISRLETEGELERLVCKYLCGPSTSPQ